MAIILPSGFNITNNEPVDARLTLVDETAKYALSSANVYEGLIVFQQDNDTIWVLTDTSNVGNSNGWTQLQIGSVSSNLPSGVVSGSDQLTSSYDSRYVNETDFTSFSSSVDGRLDLLETNSSSLESIFEEKASGTHILVSGSSQVIGILDSLNLYTQSNDTTNSTQNSRLDQLSTYTGSNETVQSAQNSRLSSLETKTGSLDTEQSAQNSRLSSLETKTGSLDTEQSTQNSRLSQIESVTASLDSTFEEKASGTHTLVSGSSQIIGILDPLNTFSSSVTDRLNQLSTDSGSQANRLTNIESFSSSFDTAFDISGTNVTIAGNLTVAGTQSIINSTTVQIGDNIIELNGSGATNAGLLVKDPTAPNTISGSLLWDSTNDYWKAGAVGAESKLLTAGGDGVVSGSSQITYSGISSIPSGIVSGSSQVIPLLPTGVVSGSSQVIGILSSLNTYTGSNNTSIANLNSFSASALTRLTDLEGTDILVSLSGDVSGSGTITNLGSVTITTTIQANSVALGTDTTGNYVGTITAGNGIVTTGATTGEGVAHIISVGGGVVSGSAQIDALGFLKVGGDSVISGSSQITLSGDITGTANNTAIGTGVIVNADVNASAAIAYTKLNLGNSGIVSGSTQITPLLPSGTVSGSSQVNADTITNFDANVLTYNNSLGVVSGSAQITKTLQQVTTAGNTTSTSISITNTTASTSKTTGALIVTGGIGTSGDVFAGGDVVAFAASDRRLKDNITPIENSLEKINSIGGYSFVWNEKQDIYNGKDYGVIAQEIEQILPELVETRDNGYKAVKYDKLVSLLIEGIKDLSKQVEDLKEKINKR